MSFMPELDNLSLDELIARFQGPDGALWFTEQKADRIGRITISGEIREFPLPEDAKSPDSIAGGSDGTVLIVEPMAADSIEGSVNPVSRLYSAASVFLCTPNAIASGEVVLGNQVPEQRLREIVAAGGLTQFRRATDTPLNRIFAARR